MLFRAALVSVAVLGSAALADTGDALVHLEEGRLAEAAAAFQSAYDAGDGDGAFFLGRLFELGVGTQADPARAANLYAAGVERGSALAMNRLGIMYQEGDVLLRDYAEATRLLCQAAEAGDANGMFNCGLAHFNGQGVPRDVNAAISQWEKASEADNIAARNFLGQIWLTGDEDAGLEADPVRARGYFEQTAEAGNALGLFQLAQIEATADAEGTPANAVEAYKFASLAAVRGLRDAAALRDRLEADMSRDDVLAAQAAAKSWTEARMAEAQEIEGDAAAQAQ